MASAAQASQRREHSQSPNQFNSLSALRHQEPTPREAPLVTLSLSSAPP
jgi:hypothetical protein